VAGWQPDARTLEDILENPATTMPIAKLLLDSGFAKNFHPFKIANRDIREAVLDYIVSHPKDFDLNEALEEAIKSCPELRPTEAEQISIAERLIKAGASIESVPKTIVVNGGSLHKTHTFGPLFYLGRNLYEASGFFKALFDHGVKLKPTDVFYFLRLNDVSRLERFLNNVKLDVNAPIAYSLQPQPLLHYACASCINFETLEYLIVKVGADPCIVHGGETPLSILLGLLEWSSEDDKTSIFASAKLLLQKGVDVTVGKSSPLQSVASYGSPEFLALLLHDGKADINGPGGDGNTCLTSAVMNKNAAMVDAILAVEGINPNAAGPSGWPPIVGAVKSANFAMVEMLLASGAVEINNGDGAGWTALHHAANNGNPDILKTLIAKGADLAATTKDGLTAADLAKRQKQKACLAALQEASGVPVTADEPAESASTRSAAGGGPGRHSGRPAKRGRTTK